MTVVEPFWGAVASSFLWEHASLPDDGVERFGGDEESTELLSEEFPLDGGGRDDTILSVARRSLVDAVDVMSAFSWQVAREEGDEADLVMLADFAADAVEYAIANPHPEWLGDVDNDDAFLGHLLREVERPAEPATREVFGGRPRLRSWLAESASRASDAPARITSTAVLRAARPAGHRAAATFLGDAMTYLRQREQHGAHGQIAAIVASGLEQAQAARTTDDPRTLVIAHSMGGNIVYDLLSHLRTDLSCDTLVTVGSQPGVFAELGLFPAVERPADPTVDRVPALTNVRHWINVFDPADVLAFAAERIFDGAEDFWYRTGKGLLKAHSSYFGRPSLYVRLAARLSEKTA
ncbi:hypothetical protein [Actinomadura sp. WMMA1423]|uniref:hypothetical protein n=1 Tax=Actinomadura sp. WMMA1423 TaxID=2591108 RepID=UPI0011461FF4|nr:hypothetical protein [Actinomadura sp. WMMA1423]